MYVLLPLLLALLCTPVLADDALFDAQGYRISQYRSPTPEHAEHAITLDTPALQALLERSPSAQLIDVYRRTWLHGQFASDEPHANLPGSLWLANAGDGQLSAQWHQYFSHYLDKVTQAHADSPLVFYCRSDCWASWNAIKRAHAMGYRNLYWYRNGIDAWEQAGLPLVPAQPAPLP